MRIARGLRVNQPNDFEVYSNDTLVTAFAQIAGTIRVGALFVSAIALLAAGVGIMNVMLVSVTERTREIGVRKAIGARRRDIVRQFLTEAVVLTSAGGLLGMTLGWLFPVASHFVFPSLPTLVPLWSVALGIGVSVAICLFFGIWPASKAARLDPV